MTRVVRRLSALFFLLVFISGCDLSTSSQPSVIVIAVEGLSFETLSCDTEGLEGFKAFCEESVRFSHAFTPSTMSQAAVASLLTAQYPFEHGVRHNGSSNFLSAKTNTLAEGALARNYHTLLVSGGPPLWRKSGLAQGFEIFDDTMDLGLGTYYRPAGEVVRLATQWLDQPADGRPALAVLFFADLQFPQVATENDEGEMRELSSEAQLAEIDESLGTLIQWLKARKRWNTSHIVLVGLNAMDGPEPREPAPLNLHTRATQVSLFIKPARKERDNVIQWAVDRNVSLVDVGYTMFEWLGVKAPAATLSEIPPQSLVSVLSEPEPRWKEGRLLLSETAWPDWLEGSGVRLAIRQNQFLYIHDKPPRVFNTLLDRMENLALKKSDPLWNSLNGDVLELLGDAKTPPFKGMNSFWPEQLAVARELWSETPVLREPRGNEAWSRWYLRRALGGKQWREVKRLAQESGDPIGIYVANRQLGEPSVMPKHPCVRLMLATKGDKKTYQSECEDERVLALFGWTAARNDDDRAAAQDRLLRLQAQSRMDDEIGRLNYLNGLRWDVDRQWPAPPQTVDYLLTLKEYESYAKRISSALARKDLRL